MQLYDASDPGGYFEVLGGTERSQGATMMLAPGESGGGPDNAHPESDQWLYVVSGTGEATVEGEKCDLSAGSFLLVEPGEGHAIANTGEEPLVTINVYAPPDY